ncbi:copper chaperone PCu(A)C [Porticoccus sp.]
MVHYCTERGEEARQPFSGAGGNAIVCRVSAGEASLMSRNRLVALLIMWSAPLMAGEFVVSDAYIRGLPPDQTVTAAFMTLSNGLDRDCHLVGASSPLTSRAEVHAHSHHGGTMSMRPVDVLTIPAGQQVRLQPGGYHLMLFGWQGNLSDGEQTAITLLFENCEKIEFSVPVRSVLSEGGNG